jgi:hypothetical protein
VLPSATMEEAFQAKMSISDGRLESPTGKPALLAIAPALPWLCFQDLHYKRILPAFLA